MKLGSAGEAYFVVESEVLPMQTHFHFINDKEPF